MLKTCWLAVLTIALSPLPTPAQEFTIKFGKPAPGDTFQVKSHNHTDIAFKVLDAGGGVLMDKTEVKTHEFIFREVALAGGKVKRTYKKAQRSTDGDRRTLPFQGETLLIDKKEGGSTFQIEGGEAIAGDDAKELREEFDKNAGRAMEMFIPKKAVKLDEAWKFNVDAVVKEFNKDGKLEIDGAKSNGVGKLLKTYQKDGKQFGVIELTMTLPVIALIHDDEKKPTKQGKFVLKIEMTRCIDGSVGPIETKTSFEGDVRGEINANGMDLGLEITINGKAEDQRIPAAK